jgi:hypothetical protein
VAVNHFNTGHPHVHVIVNGRDELGEDLVINGDYIAHGIRERASELVTLELGPVTAIEQQRKLAAEIDQDRFTRIDRALIAEAGEGLVDLRHTPADPRGISDRALRLARLGKLEAMGLASEVAPGRWQLSEKLEPTLRELGERGDVIKTMHRALQADGLARDPASFWIHDRFQADRRALERQVRAGRERPRIYAGALAASDREPSRPRGDGRRPGWISVVAVRPQIGAFALIRKMRQTIMTKYHQEMSSWLMRRDPTRFTPDAAGEAGAECRRTSLAVLGQRICAGERARPRSGGAARSSAFWTRRGALEGVAAARHTSSSN